MKMLKKIIATCLSAGMLFSFFVTAVSADIPIKWIPVEEGKEPPVRQNLDNNEMYYVKGKLVLMVRDTELAVRQYEEKKMIINLEIELETDKLSLENLAGAEREKLASKIAQNENLVSEYYKNQSAFQKVVFTDKPMTFIESDGAYWELEADDEIVYFCFIHFDEDAFADVMQALTLISEDPNVYSANPDLIMHIPDTDAARQFIIRNYRTTLDRIPDEEGLEYWVTNLKDTENKEFTAGFVVKSFFYSPEYLGRDRINEEFIEDLYTTMMDRKPDAEGMVFWMEKLSGGEKRENIINFFIQSDEFANLCADYAMTVS